MSSSSQPSLSSQSASTFDKNLLRVHLDRARRNFDANLHCDFILRWAENEILYRIKDIKRSFEHVAVFSPFASKEFSEALRELGMSVDIYDDMVLKDEEIIDLPKNSYDFIISFFDLQKVNDLPGWLIQTRHALKPDGALMACLVGGNSLFQLRQSLLAAEIKVMGGASPRVSPFVTKQQMGALLQRTGFILPVVDSETLTADYSDIFHLMKDLRAMGEANALIQQHKKFSPSRLFHEAGIIYKDRFMTNLGKLPANFEVIFLIGWTPPAK